VKNKGLKITLVMGIIILLSIISFCGFYTKGIYQYENKVPSYLLGDGVTGHRTIVLVPEEVVEENEAEEGTPLEGEFHATVEEMSSEEAAAHMEEEPEVETGNTKEMMTEDNYAKAKEIVEKRLANLTSDAYYTIKLDEPTGKIHITVLDNSYTDTISSILVEKGVFNIIDTESKEVLLDNSSVKKASVQYTYGEMGGAIVFLNIEFTDEGKEKLKDITKTYIKTTDEEGKEVEKTVTMKIDDTEVIKTFFDQEITSGSLQLTVGAETTDNATMQEYLTQASNMAVVIAPEAMPLKYVVDENVYTSLGITIQDIETMIIAVTAIGLVLCIYLVIKYRQNGLVSIITLFGILAGLLLAIRFTNVVLTAESIGAIILTMLIAFLAKVIILKDITPEDDETEIKIKFLDGMKTIGKIVLPIAILTIVLCFVKWLPVYSFAMTLFWGILIIAIFEFAVMRTLLLGTKK